ncbi:MAG: outer membrane protein assembly factor BamE [Cyanobacteria bacterium J06635_10]
MKKIILTAALAGLFPLSFTANQSLILAQSPQTTQTQTSIIAVSEVGIGKIRPGMSEQQVRSILGKPTSTKTEYSEAVGDNIRTVQYPDISLSLVPHVNKPKNFFVYGFFTWSRKFSTKRGIKVGDTQSQVIKSYGKPYIFKDGKATFLQYFVGSKDSAVTFTFSIESGKVTEIQYYAQPY